PQNRADLVESAKEFLSTARDSIGLTEDVSVFASEPLRLNHPDGSSTLWFDFQPNGISYFQCGTSVTFDRSGTIRTITSRVPVARAEAASADPTAAIEFLRK